MNRPSFLKRWGALLGILLLSFALFTWSLRSEVRDFMYRSSQPKLPPAVPFVIPERPRPMPLVLSPGLATSTTSNTSTVPSVEVTSSLPVVPTTTSELPKSVNLAIPFILQAPNQNWDMPYQEACEEASMLMVKGYFEGRTKAYTTAEMDALILALVDYETRQGYGPDITAAQVQSVLRDHLGFTSVQVVNRPTALQLKQALAAGHPVIVPADGKALKNPNFRNGGPPYHMFVLKGYTEDGKFITNDPGTRRGPDYLYTEKVLMNAIHDWNDGDVPSGAARVLIVSS